MQADTIVCSYYSYPVQYVYSWYAQTPALETQPALSSVSFLGAI